MKHLFFSLIAGICLFGMAAYGVADETQQKILDLKHQILTLQNEGELGFNNVTFCSDIRGPGMYTPLPSNVISQEQFFVYYEPVNPYTEMKDGKYLIHFTQDLYLLDQEGNVLFGKEQALEFSYETLIPVLDLYVTNTITLTDAPAGTYNWKAVLHDQLSGKSAEYMKEFIINH